MIRGLEGILAEHAFFRGMSEAQIALLAGCASNPRYRAGETIFRQGQDAREFFLIRHGRVAVELDAADRGRLTLQTLGEGEILGWAWIVPPYVQRFDARALELTRVVALDGACLRGKFAGDHELGYELLTRFVAVMTQRLEAARLQLLHLYAPPASAAPAREPGRERAGGSRASLSAGRRDDGAAARDLAHRPHAPRDGGRALARARARPRRRSRCGRGSSRSLPRWASVRRRSR